MSSTVRARAGRALDAVARARTRAAGPSQRTDARMDRLAARIDELEAEVQECRRLNRRLAELTDVVEELLLPLSQRDEAGAREHLDRYRAGL